MHNKRRASYRPERCALSLKVLTGSSCYQQLPVSSLPEPPIQHPTARPPGLPPCAPSRACKRRSSSCFNTALSERKPCDKTGPPSKRWLFGKQRQTERERRTIYPDWTIPQGIYTRMSQPAHSYQCIREHILYARTRAKSVWQTKCRQLSFSYSHRHGVRPEKRSSAGRDLHTRWEKGQQVKWSLDFWAWFKLQLRSETALCGQQWFIASQELFSSLYVYQRKAITHILRLETTIVQE